MNISGVVPTLIGHLLGFPSVVRNVTLPCSLSVETLSVSQLPQSGTHLQLLFIQTCYSCSISAAAKMPQHTFSHGLDVADQLNRCCYAWLLQTLLFTNH